MPRNYFFIYHYTFPPAARPKNPVSVS